MILEQLQQAKKISPPPWLVENTMYLTLMGSEVYGCSDDSSDKDYYGFCIPPKDVAFPHLAGDIPGFGKQKKRFNNWFEHHIKHNDTEYDICVYNIVDYFQLLMENNPNIIDSIFVPENCIVHQTRISQMVRDNRKMFIHKGCYHKCKGYSYRQLHKIRTKKAEGKRVAIVEKFGFDVKFATHLIRLLNECEQLLVEGDLDLQRNREQLKSVRRGEWTQKEIEDYFTEKEKILEKLYAESSLPYGPDEEKIKQLLLDCLEEHYGSLGACVQIVDPAVRALREISEIIGKVKF